MSICISGQREEYLGFANYLVYQTLVGAKKNLTACGMEDNNGLTYQKQEDGTYATVACDRASCKDYDMVVGTCVNKDESDTDHGRLQLYKNYTDAWVTSKSAAELATQVASDVSAINTSWGSALTVDTIIYNIGPGANGTNTRGCTWKRHYGGTDAIDSSHYDKVIGASDKHIHVTFNDLSESNSHWIHTMARYEEAAPAGTDINWDERSKNFLLNKQTIDAAYPTTDADFKLYIDKILNKDATHYTELCAFIGKPELSANTWKSYVSSYLTYVGNAS